MKITVIGADSVDLLNGTCLAEPAKSVFGLDTDKRKVDMRKRGESSHSTMVFDSAGCQPSCAGGGLDQQEKGISI